jgi:uncharacterized phage protein gp47/JayE
MAYFAPYIDSTGLHLPLYADIAAYELAQYETVFGQSVSNDDSNADIQWCNIFSLLINDAFQVGQLAYNARSPITAIGSDLDAVVAINGIARKSASYSTALITVSGIAGTFIPSGVVQDNNAFLWQLPNNITIPLGGSINVTATCTTVGAIAAAANTITLISTPTGGWNSATNASPAVVGLPVETDSQLRARQAISVSRVAKTLVQSTISAIAEVPNVSRYYNDPAAENPTGGTDIYGNPAHSISMVAEGGLDLDIATAIYNNKTPGCLTNGTTTVPVTDPNSGAVTNISFFRPTNVPIFVTLVVSGLNGFTSATITSIQTAILNYLNALQIGENLTISGLYAAAMAVMPNILLPQFTIKAIYANDSTGASGLRTFAVNAGGTGYVVGDVLTVAGGTGGQLKVAAVAAGVVTALAFIVPGTGYAIATGSATTGGTGTGCTVNITAIGATTSTDVSITFNDVVEGLSANITVESV